MINYLRRPCTASSVYRWVGQLAKWRGVACSSNIPRVWLYYLLPPTRTNNKCTALSFYGERAPERCSTLGPPRPSPHRRCGPSTSSLLSLSPSLQNQNNKHLVEQENLTRHEPPPPPPGLLLPLLRRGRHGGERRRRWQRVRGAAVPRPAHRAAAQGGAGVPRGRGGAVRGAAVRAVHGQVRERGAVRRQHRWHHLAWPDRRPLRRRGPGPLPLVPRPRHPPRRPGLRHHPFRRRRRRQALHPLLLRVPPRLRPRPRRREPIR